MPNTLIATSRLDDPRICVVRGVPSFAYDILVSADIGPSDGNTIVEPVKITIFIRRAGHHLLPVGQIADIVAIAFSAPSPFETAFVFDANCGCITPRSASEVGCPQYASFIVVGGVHNRYPAHITVEVDKTPLAVYPSFVELQVPGYDPSTLVQYCYGTVLHSTARLLGKQIPSDGHGYRMVLKATSLQNVSPGGIWIRHYPHVPQAAGNQQPEEVALQMGSVHQDVSVEWPEPGPPVTPDKNGTYKMIQDEKEEHIAQWATLESSDNPNDRLEAGPLESGGSLEEIVEEIVE